MARSTLALVRAKKHWTLQHAATLLGVGLNTLNRWEMGKQQPQPDNIVRLCEVYGCSVEALGLEQIITPQTVSMPLLDDDSALSVFLKSNVTIRLLSLTDVSRSYTETHREFMHILEEGAMISRRKAIGAIAVLAVRPVQALNLSPLVASTRPAEEVLRYCTPGVAACWELSLSKELVLALDTVSAYIPTLQHVVKQTSSEQQRKDSAHLLVQCLLLKTRLVRDLKSSEASIACALQAMEYSDVAADPVLQVLALRTLACSQYFANQWLQAATTVRQAADVFALNRNTPIPPMVKSYVYAGVATYQAQVKQKDEALQALQVAHTSFYAQSPNEPVPIWVDHSLANLFSNDGRTHMNLNRYTDASVAFEKIVNDSRSSPQKVCEAAINRALVEVDRNDQPRDMEFCIAQWTQGLQGAIVLHDELQFNVALQVYTAMRAAWPAEQPIKNLRDLIVHW